MIGGWTTTDGRFRSLLVGVHRGAHFVYIGRVGTGYSADKVRKLVPRLKALATARSPFTGIGAPRKEANVKWTRPELVAEIEFAGWTGSGMVRQAAFKGLREDKPAAEVEAEKPARPAKTELRSPVPDGDVPHLASGGRGLAERRRTGHAKPVVFGVVISHPEKPLWPDAGDGKKVTKLDLARYLDAVGPWLIRRRALRPEVARRSAARRLRRIPSDVPSSTKRTLAKTKGSAPAKNITAKAQDRSRPLFGLSLATQPMEARLAQVLPEAGGWQYEPKWDGFRCLAFKAGKAVELRAKSGKPLGRYFPEILALLRDVAAKRFVLDGELVIDVKGYLSFEALQARLHPAESRIRKLSAATPARMVLFDILLAPDGARMVNRPLTERRRALENFVESAVVVPGRLVLSPATRDVDRARAWLAKSGGSTDGVVAKRLDGAYEAGERAMVKVKRLRTADCVVGGFRYQTSSRQVGSLLLGLYDEDGRLDHVGFTSTITDEERPALTRRLEALRQQPGFTGKAPGGPSRWSTERSGEWEPLQPKLVVEVRFDQVTGDRFRHGTKLLRWRPDKRPRQCTFGQIEPLATGQARGK